MLTDFFQDNPKAAIAFSGGVDSSYLFYSAVKSGADVCAYFVKTELQPDFELELAVEFAENIAGRLKVLHLSALGFAEVVKNDSIRCYHCKKKILDLISREAGADGYSTVLDGNNASDSEADRPGMKAVKEYGVLSPLRELGLTKQDIRRLSHEFGLVTWNKPAYSCLATRIPTGTPLTKELLAKVESSENILFELGFTDFRARLREGGTTALIQFPMPQLETAKAMWDTIKNKLASKFTAVELDPNPRA